VYKSKKNAKESLQNLVREYNLCPRLLGLEKGKGRCFASQIGICRGACTNAEEPKNYNRRFNKAFEKTRVARWPFGSTMVIKEENIEGLTELHFVDNWVYLGSVVFSQLTQEEPKVEKYSPVFDWDIYKILSKVLFKLKDVHPITREEKALFFN
jgi:DNA polymerase-3 subunit epsilon